MPRVALPLVLVAALVLPVSANAAGPTRAPLAPQKADGPSLHPSGNNRYIENGKSGTQGKAASDPDGLYNYGVDQFGLGGGLYLSDQDGNNGCGNDQDFEDDNNGLCGRTIATCPIGTTATWAMVIGTHGQAFWKHQLTCTTITSTPTLPTVPTTESSSTGSVPSQTTTAPISTVTTTSPTPYTGSDSEESFNGSNLNAIYG